MITPVTSSMPSNTTYNSRSVTLFRYKKKPLIGVLEIKEDKKTSRYSIVEDTDSNVSDRIFRLAKPTAAGGGIYFVCIAGDSDRFHQCECRGFESGGTCKHIQAIASLIRANHA